MGDSNYEIELEFLGTGTSTGVPQVGCSCEVCKSKHFKDKRLRASVIVRTKGKNILIDCGPDFRTQILRATDYNVDALVITHVHYDHVGGVDDLRPYCYGPEKFPIFAREEVLDDLRNKMPYSFSDRPYPGAPVFATKKVLSEAFDCCGVMIEPLLVWHGNLLINGYRIGDLAYITDAKTIDEETIAKLAGVKVLVINGLRYVEHMSHMTVGDALDVIGRVKPERAYLTHVSHQIGLHDEVNMKLPKGVELAYDGQIVRL